MNSFSASRKLPRSLNSEPNGGGYDKDYEGGYSKVGGGSKGLGRSNGGFRRGDSPDQNNRTDRSRESPLYTKYPSQRGDRGDLRREQYSNSRKDIRDTERERDRSPRTGYSNYERKEEERKRKELESRGLESRGLEGRGLESRGLDRRVGLDRGLDSGRAGGLESSRGGLESSRGSGLEGGRGSGLDRRVNSHLNHQPSTNVAQPATTFGDWTEHRSSNGKTYYYNIQTEVSQWQKPREWLESEKASLRDRETRENNSLHSLAREANSLRDTNSSLHALARESNSSLHSLTRETNSLHSLTRETNSLHSLTSRDTNSSLHALARESNSSLRTSLPAQRESWGQRGSLGGGGGGAKQDCDTRNARSSADKHSGLDDRPRCSPSLHPGSSRHRDQKTGDRLGPGPSANSHDTNSHFSNNHTEERTSRDPTSSHRVSESNSSQGDATPTSEAEHEGREHEQDSQPGGAVSLNAALSRISSQPHALSISTQPGPGPGSRLSQLPSYPASQSPLYSPGSGQQESSHGGQASPSVLSPSLQSKLSLHTLPPPLQLTPSLSRLYRENLIGHVLSWPVEGVERCCARISEETHQISSHGLTKLSADLKMARSLVRLAEIQATLQEQRILFLRQQVADLDRVDRPISREMSRDRDTLTREGLQHRDLALRESLQHRDLALRDSLQHRDLALRDSVLATRGESLPREVPSTLSREAPRDSSSSRPSFSRELTREPSRSISLREPSRSIPAEVSRPRSISSSEHLRTRSISSSELSPMIPTDNFQSPSTLSLPR